MKRHGNCISIIKEDLVHLLYGDNYKIREIRKLVGCSAQAIKNIINRRNLKKRSLKTLRDRFYQYVDKTLACWNWTGNKSHNGYGQIKISGKTKRANRLSWELHCGEIPGRMHVLHKCDNPACVNPSHLFIGTHQDNMKDRDNKDRQAKGERTGTSVLTTDNVVVIKQMLLNNTIIEVAATVNIPKGTIENIAYDKTWTHVMVDGWEDRCMHKKYSSKHKGVIWDKNRNKWQVIVRGKFMGRFDTEEEAVKIIQQYIYGR